MIPRDYDFPPKPIEDKEPTAFQWSDESVQEYASWYFNVQGKPPPELWGKSLLVEFKKKKLSQSIPAGKGTANDVSNYDGIKFKSLWDDESVTAKHAGYVDIPTLDRQYEEGVGDERRKEVSEPRFAGRGCMSPKLGSVPYLTYEFLTEFSIPTEKYTAIKQAIENVLNGEDSYKEKALKAMIELQSHKKYTEEDLKKVWDAGAGIIYRTFQDYKQSLEILNKI